MTDNHKDMNRDYYKGGWEAAREERELIESIYAKSEKGVKLNQQPDWIAYQASRVREKIKRGEYANFTSEFEKIADADILHRDTLIQDAKNLLAETTEEREHREEVARETTRNYRENAIARATNQK